MMLQFMDKLEKNGKFSGDERIRLSCKLEFCRDIAIYENIRKNRKISSDERMRLKDKIETEDGKSKDGDSAEVVQKELKRMKIVNNKENLWDVKLTDTHFVREREREHIWKMEKPDGKEWI